MLFEYAFGLQAEGTAIRKAVALSLQKGIITEDLTEHNQFYFPDLKIIRTTAPMLNKIRIPTPPMKNRNLSDCLEAYISLKR